MSEIHVVRTGTSNLASMLAAIERVGGRPVLVERPDEVRSAARLVVPGVGAFAAARDQLVAAGLWGPLGERLGRGDPTMLVCLGLQLLCASSEESPGAEGLGVIAQAVRRFPGGVRVPQLGWNLVEAAPGTRFVESGHAYFANSYHLPEPPPGWECAMSHHGVPFVASVERGGVLACQFHPELSGGLGLGILKRWVEQSDRRARSGPTARVIPCLDVNAGRVVKGVKFAGLRDAGAPDERAALYEAQGADEIVILDVSATTEGRKTQADTVRAVRAVLGIPLTVGGGVSEPDDARRLLDAGADKVAINTAAVEQPGRVGALAERFGRQCVVVAIDAARTPGGTFEVVTRSGKHRTGIDAVAWAREAADRGAGEILLTSFDQDGTRSGYDLPLLRAVSGAVRVPVIASGGAATVEHLRDALDAGADAVLAASIFHDNDTTVGEVKAALARLGVRVRR
jgi:imidazole glycerol phosphate synthase glutamine amidotransferase subunit